VGKRPLAACRPRAGAALATLALACALALAAPATVAAQPTAPTPSCADAVIADWSDGGIEATYPARCYRDALQSLPEDMRAYTSAPDDIERALRATLARGARPGAGENSRSLSGRGSTRALQGRTPRPNPASRAVPAAGPSATSLPVPVVFVAALVAIVAAGGLAGVLARRARLRRIARGVALEAGARRARPTG
jgi:hypothetical protein